MDRPADLRERNSRRTEGQLFCLVTDQALFLGRMGRQERRPLAGSMARRAAVIRGYAAVQRVSRNKRDFFARGEKEQE